MNESLNSKKSNYIIAFLILLSATGRFLLCTYGLPYTVHVDESLIMKDPLKILLTYKKLDFHLTYNLYDYMLLFWHGVTYLFGRITGMWKNILDYRNHLAVDDYQIIFSFRLLNCILSLVGDYILIKFIYNKLKITDTAKLLASLVIILNPVTFNSVSFIKFDAFCYIFYALIIYLGYMYFVEKELKYRNRIYLILFLGLSARIELLSFLAGYFLYDFIIMFKCKLSLFFTKKFIKGLCWSICIYLVITLYPVSIIYNCFFTPKVIYTETQTFEMVILSHLRWASILNYQYYIATSLVLLSPVVIILFAIKLFKKNTSILFLLPALLINNVILALDYVKDVWYFLFSSVIILFIFIKYVEENSSKRIAVILLGFTSLYFLTYDVELLYYAVSYNANTLAKRVVLKDTSLNDTIVVCGVCDLKIPQSPGILREQIAALKEVGGSTGYGLAENLKHSIADSFRTRNFYRRVSDYFWVGTKYEDRWLIGYDTIHLKKINPKLIVISSNYNSLDEALSIDERPEIGTYINKHYNLIYQNTYTFSDPRLYYRNFYYFHSFFIFRRT